MVRRRNRDRVDGFIFEELPHVDVSLRLRQALLLHLLQTLGQHVFIDVAKRRDLSLRNLREFLHMVPPAPANAADGHADAVVRAKNSLRMSHESDPAERRQARAGLQKVTTVDFRFFGHDPPPDKVFGDSTP